jgi:hypothetical protein
MAGERVCATGQPITPANTNGVSDMRWYSFDTLLGLKSRKTRL